MQTKYESKLIRFDWAIKYLLRDKADFDVLEGFLSELLGKSIKIKQLLESEANKAHEADKFNRVDVLAITAEGEHVIIEVQCNREADFLSRILYGTSKVICENIREGDDYIKVAKVISVSIVFFDLGTGLDYIYDGTTVFRGRHNHDILGLNKEEQAIYTQKLRCEPELPEDVFPEFYMIKVSKFHDKVKNKLDEWIYFLKHSQVQKDFTALGLQTAANKLNYLKLNDEDRRRYRAFVEHTHSEASFELMLGIEKEKGREEGRKEGRKEGEKRGEKKGEKKASLSIARSLKQSGLPATEIAQHTGLSLLEIQQL